MQTIDIKKLITEQALDFNDVASHLFPTNKYPRLALNRVISGDAYLDSQQLSKLAGLARVSIESLYTTEGWKSTFDKEIITLTNGKFRAELNTRLGITKIFDKGSLFHEFVLHQHAITLKEYIAKLNTEISNK